MKPRFPHSIQKHYSLHQVKIHCGGSTVTLMTLGWGCSHMVPYGIKLSTQLPSYFLYLSTSSLPKTWGYWGRKFTKSHKRGQDSFTAPCLFSPIRLISENEHPESSRQRQDRTGSSEHPHIQGQKSIQKFCCIKNNCLRNFYKEPGSHFLSFVI